MITKNMVRIVGIAIIVAGSTGGCKCGRDVIVEDAMIDDVPLVEEKPDANPPRVNFPRSSQTDDVILNRFIEEVLMACERGDYDKFRQAFGTAYNPTSREDFRLYWENVETITVAGVYPNQQKKDSPEYFLHTVVRLREPDRKGRQTRDAVVVLFKELGEWRLVPATNEIIRRVRAASTQPGMTANLSVNLKDEK